MIVDGLIGQFFLGVVINGEGLCREASMAACADESGDQTEGFCLIGANFPIPELLWYMVIELTFGVRAMRGDKHRSLS